MRIAAIMAALLLLTACGSRRQEVRETATIDFNRQACISDSLARYLVAGSRMEADSVTISVCLDSAARPRRLRLKAHGVRRSDSIRDSVVSVRQMERSDSVTGSRRHYCEEHKNTGTPPPLLWIALACALLLLWRRK